MEINIDQLIARILNGEASSEEILQFSNWLNVDEKNKKEFCRIKSYWHAEVSPEQTITNPLTSLERLNTQLMKKKNQKKKYFLLFSSSVAAAFLLLLGFSGRYFVQSPPEEPTHYYTYITDDGKSEVILDDGTKVLLNKKSRLTYDNKYGKEGRNVDLTGEAYFEVAHDTLKPFVLTMGESSIRVLGTKFNAKSVDHGSKITATLIEGSIQFQSEGQQVLLLPDQQLSFNEQTRRIDVADVSNLDAILWTKNILKYKQIALADLICRLEETYDTEIIVKNNKLKNPQLTVSASFDENQSLEEILKVISRSVRIKWTKKGNVYYIQ